MCRTMPALLVAALLLAGCGDSGGGTPQGPEIAVNAHIDGSQLGQSVAMGDDGSFVAVWTSYVPDITTPYSYILVQRYDENGNALGVGP